MTLIKALTRVNLFHSYIMHGKCGDMSCDSKRRSILVDLDGTFLGSAGGIIPEAEYEWDGKRTYGLGDYRIPKSMLSDSKGNRIKVDTLAKHKGVHNIYITQSMISSGFKRLKQFTFDIYNKMNIFLQNKYISSS